MEEARALPHHFQNLYFHGSLSTINWLAIPGEAVCTLKFLSINIAAAVMRRVLSILESNLDGQNEERCSVGPNICIS